MKKHIEKEERSEDVQEILGKMPHWIIQWGMSFIALTIVLILIVSAFIKYPDIISGKILISTVSPPIEVVSNSPGKIRELRISDGETMKSGDIVAEIENTGNLEEIMVLKGQIDSLEKALQHPNQIPSFELSRHLRTGTMQESYNNVLTAMDKYKDLKTTHYFASKNALLEEQIRNYKENIEVISNQISIAQQELEIVKQHHEINKMLYEQGVKSKIEYEEYKAIYLKKMREVPELEKSLIDHRISLSQSSAEQLDLKRDKEVIFLELLYTLNNGVHLIKRQIRDWEQRYLLIAPIDGKVVYKEKWEENQFLGTNEHFMTLVHESKNIIGYIEVPSYGLGKVQVGQRVRIKLDAYPEDQYGQLLGTVEEIALLPTDDGYRIRVSLNEGLVSSYGKNLDFKPELRGTAEIVTTDLSLLSRLFNKLNHLINNKI
ncbi:HlyD family efflux transporter periplasmic adaptor subunit [uncultured Cyclobacterium sp.]|uniref:HlyD family efflux transporter periplasmic adaptor subunit n=1 Tax=uncultured Cyclobacterium sp. TaxID=453820 RepID=UPI0030ED86A6